MNEHVDISNPDWAADFRAFDRQLRAAPLIVLANPTTPGPCLPCAPASTAPDNPPAEGEAPGVPRHILVTHAVGRGRVALHNGQVVTLVGIEHGATAHVIDDRYRHHRIPTTQIAYTIGAPL